MNRLVLIGNGFDLAHDLKTSYADFIYWYWKQRIRNLYEEQSNISDDSLCKLIKLDGDSWSLFVFFNNHYLCNSEGKDIYNYIKENKEDFRIEFTPFFERIHNSIETKKWVDIENEYYSLLVLLHSYVKDNYLNLNNQLEFLRYKLIDYLRTESNKIIESKDSIRDKIYCPIFKNEISVTNDLYPVNKFDDKIDPSSVMLLSFNYTNTPYLYKSVNATINYIHGHIEAPQNVIIGYGDELDEGYQKLRNNNDNECLRHIKSIRYLESDNYRRMLEFVESAPFQICMMGHSCGNSDRTLLNTLFEHKNCISIKPYYHIKKDGTDNYLELVQNISRNFTDMKLMRDRVVNKTYCAPLL